MFRTTTKFTDISSIIALYNSLVRNVIEYCSPIWNPHHIKYETQIERVQKKFTRFIQYQAQNTYESYNQRLDRYDMMTLKSRRIMTNELTLYKILNGKILTKMKETITMITENRSRRHRITFRPNVVNNDVQFFSPIRRMQMNHDIYFDKTDIRDKSYENFKKQIKSIIQQSIT